MRKLFENAKFGDKFVTRGNKKALYIMPGLDVADNPCHYIIIEGNVEVSWFDDFGYVDVTHKRESSDDIVSRW